MLTLRLLFLSVSLAFGDCEQIPRQGGICYHCEHFPRRGIFNPRCLPKKASVTMYCRDTNVYCISISYQGITAGDFYGRAVRCTTRGIKCSRVWPRELCPAIQIHTRQTASLVQKCVTFCIGQGCSSLEYLQEGRTPLWKRHRMWLMDLLSKELASSEKQEVGKPPRRSGRSANIDGVALLSQDGPASVLQDSSALFNWTEQSDKRIFQASDGIAEPSTFSQQDARTAYSVPFIPFVGSSRSLILHTSHGSAHHVANSELAVGGVFEDTKTQPGPISVGRHTDFTPHVNLPTTHAFQVTENAVPTDLEDPKKSTSLTYIMGSPGSSSVGVTGYQHIGVSLPDETDLSPSFKQQGSVTLCVKALSEFDGSQTAVLSQQGKASVSVVSNHVHDLITAAPLGVPTDAFPSSAFHFMEYSVWTDSPITSSLGPVKKVTVPVLSTSVKTLSDITSVTQSGSKMTLRPFDDQVQERPTPSATPRLEKLSTKLSSFLHAFNTQTVAVKHLGTFFTDAPLLVEMMASAGHQSLGVASGSREIHFGSTDDMELSGSMLALTAVSENFETAEDPGTVYHLANSGSPSGDGVEIMESLSIESATSSLASKADQLVHSSQLDSLTLGSWTRPSVIQSQRDYTFSVLGTPESTAESPSTVSECEFAKTLKAEGVGTRSSAGLEAPGWATKASTTRLPLENTSRFETSAVNNRLMVSGCHVSQKESVKQVEHFKTSISDDFQRFFAGSGGLYLPASSRKHKAITETPAVIPQASVIPNVSAFQALNKSLGDLPSSIQLNRTSSILFGKMFFDVHSSNTLPVNEEATINPSWDMDLKSASHTIGFRSAISSSADHGDPQSISELYSLFLSPDVDGSSHQLPVASKAAGMLYLLIMSLESESMPHSLTQSEWSSDTLQTGSALSGTVQETSTAPSQPTLESDSLLVIKPTVVISVHPDDREAELLGHIARDSFVSPSFYRGTPLLSTAKMTKWNSTSSLAQVPLSTSGSLTRSTDIVDVTAFPGDSLELKVTVPSLHVVSTIGHPLFDSNENTTHLDLERFSADGFASLIHPTETLDLAKTDLVSLKPEMFPLEVSSHMHPTSISAPKEDTKPLPQSNDVTVHPTRLSSFQSVDEELSTALLEFRSMLALLGAGTPTLQLSELAQGDRSPTQFLRSLPFGDLASSYDLSIEGTGTVMKAALPMSGDLYTAGSSALDYSPLSVPSSASYRSYAMGPGGFEKATSKLETILGSRKMTPPTAYPSSHRGDATLLKVSIQSEFVLPSKDITQSAVISSVLSYPHRETPCLEPQCILSTMQHSHLGFNKFSLVAPSLSSSVDRTDVLHLDNDEMTKVSMEASEEAISSTSLSSVAVNAGGHSSIVVGPEATFPLTDLHESVTQIVLNSGWFSTSIEEIPRTSLDLTGSEDFSNSMSDSALQSTRPLEARSTAIISKHVLADVSNTLMETEKIPSSLVESNSFMQSPGVIISNAISSEYFTLGQENPSWFLDVSNSVKDSIHLLTPEVFSISISGSRTFSPMPMMPVSFNDTVSLSYSNINADSFTLETLPKLHPESLWRSEASILKQTSQQSELDSLPLHTEITGAPVLVAVSSGMPTYLSENIFLSVTDTLASGSSVPVSSPARDTALPFPTSAPSEVKTTIPASVSSDPKLMEVFTEFSMQLGDSALGFSRVLQENPSLTNFLSAAPRSLVDTMFSLQEAVIVTPSPESFLYVESLIPITIVPTLTEPDLVPISSLGAESVFVGSKSTQISEETSAFSNSTLPLPSSQMLNQSLIDFPSLAPSALTPLEGGSCANPSTPCNLVKVTHAVSISEEPSFVPRATLPSSSTPPLTSNIEPSIQGKTSSPRLKTMSSSADGVPPSTSREMLQPTLQLTGRPTDAAARNPTVPVPSPHPTSSSGSNRTELALIKEENLLEVTLQVNGSVLIFEDAFRQSVSEGLQETYLQALRFTVESDKTRRRGQASEEVQVVIESVSRQNSDDVVVQFVVLSNGQLLKAADVTETFERLPKLVDVLNEELPYQVVKAPCPIAAPLPQPPTHSRPGWMVAVSVLGSFCLALLVLLLYCKKKGWRGGEDISVSQQVTFRRVERAEASSVIQLQERKQRVSDVEKGLPEGRLHPKPLLPRLPELETSEQYLSAPPRQGAGVQLNRNVPTAPQDTSRDRSVRVVMR